MSQEDETRTLTACAESRNPAALRPAGPPRRHARLGRYVVLRCLGSGGAGVVYAAYDPQLDRKVAVKVLRRDRAGREAGGRLLREARYLARLRHPNVVRVHDVASDDGEVFFAMEFLTGPTLSEWLDSGEPDRRRILEVFSQAGRGLAAAHRAGLVHGDFKPNNVMFGADGRVRVVDFGLARRHPSTAGSRPALPAGTPGYMAPELLGGRPPDERSDQYAFCVAIWRALLDERRQHRIPAGIRGVLRRGMAEEPAARFPSMERLLSKLTAASPTAWRRRAVAFAGTVVLAFGVSAYLLVRADDERRCRAAGDAVRQLGSAGPGGFESSLGAYLEELASVSEVVCEATLLRGEQSASLLRLRQDCLEDRSRAAEAFIAFAGRQPAPRPEDAAAAVSDLPAVAPCVSGDPAERLRKEVPEDLRRHLAEGTAKLALGRNAEAIEDLRSAATLSRELGLRRHEADALIRLAEAHGRLGDLARQSATLHEAAYAAQVSQDARLLARVGIGFVEVARLESDSLALARWSRIAAATLERLGGDPRLEARLARAVDSRREPRGP